MNLEKKTYYVVYAPSLNQWYMGTIYRGGRGFSKKLECAFWHDSIESARKSLKYATLVVPDHDYVIQVV